MTLKWYEFCDKNDRIRAKFAQGNQKPKIELNCTDFLKSESYKFSTYIKFTINSHNKVHFPPRMRTCQNETERPSTFQQMKYHIEQIYFSAVSFSSVLWWLRERIAVIIDLSFAGLKFYHSLSFISYRSLHCNRQGWEQTNIDAKLNSLLLVNFSPARWWLHMHPISVRPHVEWGRVVFLATGLAPIVAQCVLCHRAWTADGHTLPDRYWLWRHRTSVHTASP